MDFNAGVIYPITLALLLIFSYLLMDAAVKYETEKAFFHEAKKIDQLEVLLFLAIKDVEQIIEELEIMSEGYFTYTIGNVTYKVISETDEYFYIDFHCRTIDEESKFTRTLPIVKNTIQN